MPGSTQATRTPLARQIAEDLRRRIVAGEFAPGSRLPSEAEEVSSRFEVARTNS